MENPVMLLCDIGNTSYHFFDGELSYKEDVLAFEPQNIEEKVYFISVNATIKEKLKNLENWIDLSLHIDMNEYYKTMGIDRIFALQTLENAVIVDAGSAITVDVVKNGVFMGGFIYPGVNAMRQTYKNISLALDYEFNFSLDVSVLPKNSQDALSYAYLKLLFSEVISHNLPIVLTGGDALKLQTLFPTAHVDETLIFKGMKKIIQELHKTLSNF